MSDPRLTRLPRPATADDAFAGGIALAVLALGLLALFALEQELSGLVALVAGAALLISPLVPRSPPTSPASAALTLGLGVSLVVAERVDGSPPSSYWPAFFLWLAAAAFPVVVASRACFRSSRKRLRRRASIHAREIAVVAGLTGLAALLRLHDLSRLPWPFSGDEARFFLQALAVKEGEIVNMFATGYQGNPEAHFFALRALIAMFGESIVATRLYGVILGTLLVPVTYVFLRSLFDRNVALLGASFATAYHFALHYSRQNMNNIADAAVLSLVLLFLWRSLTYGKTLDYLATGLLSGFGLYVVVESRAAVPVVAAAWIIAFVQRSGARKQHLRGLAYLVGGFLLAAAPIAFFWFSHPGEFANRINDVGVIQSGWLEREADARNASQASVLWTQAVHNFGAFGYYRDTSPFYGGPSSLVDRAALPFFLIGAALALFHVRQPRYQLLLLGFVVVVVGGGVLTVGSPASQRLVGTIPVVIALVAVGVDAATRHLARLIKRERQAPAFALTVMLVLVAYNAYSYFGPYARADSYSDFNTRVATAGTDFLRSMPPGTSAFWYGAPTVPGTHPSVVYGVRDLRFFEVLEDGSILTTSRPGPGAAAFVFLRERKRDRDVVMAACPRGRLERVVYRKRDFMFWTYLSPPEGNCALAVSAASGALISKRSQTHPLPPSGSPRRKDAAGTPARLLPPWKALLAAPAAE